MGRRHEAPEERLLRAIFAPETLTPERPCIRGCTFTDDEGVVQAKPARHGDLCGSCYWRIRYRLAEAPKIVVALRTTMLPMKAASYEGRVGGTKEQVIPFLETVAPEADVFYGIIVDWATSHAEALGGAAAVSAPAAVWRQFETGQNSRGMSSSVSADAAGRATSEVVEWLVRWGKQIAALPAAVAYHDDIVAQVARYRRVAGLVPPRPTVVRARECDICFEKAVEVDIPDVGPLIVRCRWCHSIIAGVGGVDLDRDLPELVA